MTEFTTAEERDALILKLLRWGWTRRAMAQALGISVGKVNRIVDAHKPKATAA